MNLFSLTDPKIDQAIRAALRDADSKNKLGVVAAVTGIAGGEAALRDILFSTDELPVLVRGVLAMHLLY